MQDSCGKKCNFLLLSKVFINVFLIPWKRNTFKIAMKFHIKKGKINFQSLVYPSFHEIQYSLMLHMNQMEPIFQDLHFYCTKNVPRNHNKFCHFCHGGWNPLPGGWSDLDLTKLIIFLLLLITENHQCQPSFGQIFCYCYFVSLFYGGCRHIILKFPINNFPFGGLRLPNWKIEFLCSQMMGLASRLCLWITFSCKKNDICKTN